MNKKLFILALTFAMIFSISCQQVPKQQKTHPASGVESSISGMGTVQNIRITTDYAPIRSGISSNSPIMTTAGKNKIFDVIGEVTDWFVVKGRGNQIGFVHKIHSTPIVVGSNTPNPNTDGGATGRIPLTNQGGSMKPRTPQTSSSQSDLSALTPEEREMVQLVNAARSQSSLPPLKVDIQLANAARAKAQDMIDSNYFSHYSPRYGSPFDMMKAFGIKFVKAGENIAGNQSVRTAEAALMNSQGHRQNILDPSYTHIGIGIKNGGPYGKMFSQMFISKPQ